MLAEQRDTSKHDQSRAIDLLGDVKGKNVLIVDDVLSTGGSLLHAAELVEVMGARDVYAAITHGLFTKGALERIKDSPKEIICNRYCSAKTGDFIRT